MSLGPYPSEQMHDTEFEKLVEHLCVHPLMFVTPSTYGTVCAFLQGFDIARGRGPLLGLHPWLVVRAGDGNNRTWSGLAEQQLSLQKPDAEESSETQSIRALGRLLGEFFEYRRANGLTKIYYDYARWLLRRKWYTGPLRRNKDAEE